MKLMLVRKFHELQCYGTCDSKMMKYFSQKSNLNVYNQYRLRDLDVDHDDDEYWPKKFLRPFSWSSPPNKTLTLLEFMMRTFLKDSFILNCGIDNIFHFSSIIYTSLFTFTREIYHFWR